jgi:hypothetical protein
MNRENLQKGVALVKEIDYISTKISIWHNADDFSSSEISLKGGTKVDSRDIDFRKMKIDTMAILNDKLIKLKEKFESLKSD